MKWEAHFHVGYLNMPGIGRCPTGYQCVVEADTREEAIGEATVNALDFDERARFESIHPILTYAVKVKSKSDKRKRETFLIKATSAGEAERFARHGHGASGLAAERYGGHGKKQQIVSVEQVAS